MFREKVGDPRDRGNEMPGELRKPRFADDDDQRHAMANDHGALVRFVPDAFIVAYGNPAAIADGAQPLLISTIGREMIAVAFYLQSRGGKNVRKACSEVAVREENKVQAARSYSTACSISVGLRP